MFQLRKILPHILIWAFMLLYLVIAPNAYARFILRDDSPVPIDVDLPASTEQIRFSVDRMDTVTINGRSGYNLWGWAFLVDEEDQSKYERFVVLRSSTGTYFFTSKSQDRPDVQSAFEDLKIDVSTSGYATYLTKDSIPRGVYQLGILFRNKVNGISYFIETNKNIARTANHITLSH